MTAVNTNQGKIVCEKVVNCGGQWARQIGAMAGVSVPLQPVKHQYVITEKVEGLAADAATIRDPDRRTYFKEEVGGLVFGGYEPDPIAWTQGDVPDNFEFQLFEDDWDHFEQHMTEALVRVPALENTGIKKMINGPESFTPDGNFILGAAPELKNFYVGAGFNAFGIASGGGAGWVLADWVARDEAPMDLWVVDIRRFSDLHKDRTWTSERTLEAYGKHYTIGFPHEEYQSGRPRIVSPLYDRLEETQCLLWLQAGLGTAQLVCACMARRRATSTPWAGRTGLRRWARSTDACASAWACSTNHPLPSMSCAGKTRRRRWAGFAPITWRGRWASSPIRRC